MAVEAKNDDIQYLKDLVIKYKTKYRDAIVELADIKRNSNIYHLQLRLDKLETDYEYLVELANPKPKAVASIVDTIKPSDWNSLEELIWGEKPFATACKF